MISDGSIILSGYSFCGLSNSILINFPSVAFSNICFNRLTLFLIHSYNPQNTPENANFGSIHDICFPLYAI